MVFASTKIVNEGKKIERTDLQLNLVLKSFYLSSVSSEENSDYTSINFYFPTDTDNRKFTLKIGKITDYSILNKIQKNDYDGIKELLDKKKYYLMEKVY